MAKSSSSTSNAPSYAGMASAPAYMQWVRQEKFSTDYFNAEYLAEYAYLESQGMV